MLTPSYGVVGLVSSYGLFLLIVVSLQGFKCIRACRRSQRRAPGNLSSDEEDDREFRQEFANNRQQQQEQEIERNEEILRSHLREVIERNAHRRQ